MKKIWKIFVGVIFLAVCSGCGIKKEQKKTIEDTKEKIYRECEMLAEDYQSIYENAAKENALYELSTIQKSMDYFGKYGYAANQTQNSAVIAIMKHAFSTIPGILWIVTAIVLFFYRLNKKRYNEIVEDLKRGKTTDLRNVQKI